MNTLKLLLLTTVLYAGYDNPNITSNTVCPGFSFGCSSQVTVDYGVSAGDCDSMPGDIGQLPRDLYLSYRHCISGLGGDTVKRALDRTHQVHNHDPRIGSASEVDCSQVNTVNPTPHEIAANPQCYPGQSGTLPPSAPRPPPVYTPPVIPRTTANTTTPTTSPPNPTTVTTQPAVNNPTTSTVRPNPAPQVQNPFNDSELCANTASTNFRLSYPITINGDDTYTLNDMLPFNNTTAQRHLYLGANQYISLPITAQDYQPGDSFIMGDLRTDSIKFLWEQVADSPSGLVISVSECSGPPSSENAVTPDCYRKKSGIVGGFTIVEKGSPDANLSGFCVLDPNKKYFFNLSFHLEGEQYSCANSGLLPSSNSGFVLPGASSSCRLLFVRD